MTPKSTKQLSTSALLLVSCVTLVFVPIGAFMPLSSTLSRPRSKFYATNKDENPQDPDELQNEILKSMLVSEKPKLFGLVEPRNDGAENKVPLFTGTMILLLSTTLTVYCFYVFFTGNDPLMKGAAP